jgi:hypothetical protein
VPAAATARVYRGAMILILAGFVLVLIVLWLVVRAVDRQQQKKWGGASKQQPGRPSSMESDTARFSGRSEGGSGL